MIRLSWAALTLVWSAPVVGLNLGPELELPPLGVGSLVEVVRYDLKGTSAEKYADRGVPQADLRKAVREARLLLWASSPAHAPGELEREVAVLRKDLVAPVVAGPPRVGRPPKGKTREPAHLLQLTFPISRSAIEEKVFKDRLYATSREVARLVARLESSIEKLEGLTEQRDRECPRWQAHHALTLVALQLRLVHLHEYNLALGDMRREYPEHDPKKHTMWRLVPLERPRDIVSKRLMRSATRTLGEISEKHGGTAWDQMGQGLLKVPLSVEWKPE